MDRRTFVKNATATGVALAGAGFLGNQSKAQAAGPPPNILFILVDELRYWRVFPNGILTVDQFLSTFMPNTSALLWQRGVKFAGHYTAGVACSPARGTLATGLYTQQSWMLSTVLDSPTTTVSQSPVLKRAYPTYGKLLKNAGYQTPYIGKWHLSIPHRGPDEALSAYGFQGLTDPDPTGSNLQGTIGNLAKEPGYLSDSQIASQAVSYLQQRKPGDAPWCLTVGFVNPHDKEFFPAGTEFRTFTQKYNSGKYNPNNLAQFVDYSKGPPSYAWGQNPLKDPPPLGYPAVPPNWETPEQIANNKPGEQTTARLFQAAVWGGVSSDSSATDFSTIFPYPTFPALSTPIGVLEAPYSYWQRGLDSYTQIMSILDGNIRLVIEALPPAVASNTVIVFTADHGEYAGAHGFVSGKAGSAYEEVMNVPLIVVDPTGRFTGDIDQVRMGLTSSVDILPLLVSLGYNGSQSWMTPDLATIYARRQNLLPMLKSAGAPGRPYIVFATDEPVPQVYNFTRSPHHIIGLRTPTAKLGVYANWVGATPDLQPCKIDLEYYDYTTEGGRLEIDNRKDDPAAAALLAVLVTDVLPNELRGPLPPSLVPVQTTAKAEYLAYVDLINAITTLQDTVAVLPITIGDM